MSSHRPKQSIKDPRTGLVLRGTLKDGENQIQITKDTAGILLLERVGHVKYNDKELPEYEVRVFVASAIEVFVWTVAEGAKWQVIDVPDGFAINNGDAIAALFDIERDPPVIVHGRP